jgi:cytochrome c556
VRPLVLAVLALSAAAVLSQAHKPPTNREIMAKLNRGPNALTGSLMRDLRDDEPDWPEVQEQVRDYVKLTAALTKNGPPKGDKASWERLTRAYNADAIALSNAVRKRDRRGAQAVLGRINKSCDACHQVHKEE